MKKYKYYFILFLHYILWYIQDLFPVLGNDPYDPTPLFYVYNGVLFLSTLYFSIKVFKLKRYFLFSLFTLYYVFDGIIILATTFPLT